MALGVVDGGDTRVRVIVGRSCERQLQQKDETIVTYGALARGQQLKRSQRNGSVGRRCRTRRRCRDGEEQALCGKILCFLFGKGGQQQRNFFF